MSVLVDNKNIVELLLGGAKFLWVGLDHKKYMELHIKNSIYINPLKFKMSRVHENTIRGANAILPNLPTTDVIMAETIKSMRISPKDKIVLYCDDSNNIPDTFNLCHKLLGLGFLEVYYLNMNWRDLPDELKTKDLPVWDNIPNESTSYFNDFIHSQELGAFVRIGATKVLDVRNVDEYCKEHISGAINIDWKHFFVPSKTEESVPTQTIKSLEEIYKILSTMNLDKRNSLVVTGYDGCDITPVVFILRRLLGWENVRCHFDSWHVWEYLKNISPIHFPVEH